MMACIPALAQDEAGDASAAEESKREKLGQAVSGSFRVGLDVVNANGVSDINLNQTLRLRIDPPSKEKIHIRASLWMHEDLDSDERSSSVLRDINDTFGSNVRARLLSLYLELDPIWGGSTLRIGRQRITEGVAFNRIDGLYLKRRFVKWDWYLFAGVRASIYEDTNDDLTYGGGASVRASTKTRLAIDGYYGEESRRSSEAVRRGVLSRFLGFRFPRRVKAELDDNLIAFSLFHNFTPNIRLFTKFTLDEGRADEFLVDITGYVEKWKLTYDVSYRRLLNPRGDRVNDITTFFRILGVEEEFEHLLVTLHRPVSEKFALSLEGEIHDSRRDDPQTGNRDFHRWAIVATGDELRGNVSVTAAVERWDVEGGEGTWALTGEVSKEWEDVEVSWGVDYERFTDRIIVFDPRPQVLSAIAVFLIPGVFPGFAPLVAIFDQVPVKVREDIYSVYSKVKWAIRDDQDLTVRVRYEEDEGPESPYWRMQVNYAIRF